MGLIILTNCSFNTRKQLIINYLFTYIVTK